MIQNIAPHRYHNEYHAYEICEDDYVLFYRQREVLLKYDEEQIVYPTCAEVSGRKTEHLFTCFRLMTGVISGVMKQMIRCCSPISL